MVRPRKEPAEPRPHAWMESGARAAATAPSRPGNRAAQSGHTLLSRVVERIVVPVQGTDREFLAQQWAVQFARHVGAPVRAVHVAPPSARTPADIFDYVKHEGRKWGVPIATAIETSGSVVDSLLDDLDVQDLVVLGTRKLGTHYHLGSVAEQLVRRAPCPVTVVRLP